MDKCVEHTNIILNAFNSIQLLLQPLDVELSAVSPIMSMEVGLLCQAQLEGFAWQCCWLLGSNGGDLDVFLHNEMVPVRTLL